MGYNHSWVRNGTIEAESFTKITETTKKIIEASGINICNWAGSGQPEINDELISFNGERLKGTAGETFLFERIVSENPAIIPTVDGRFNTRCKTNKNPYDLVVTAVLTTIKSLLGETILIWSEGEESDFEPGKKLAASVGVKIPASVLSTDLPPETDWQAFNKNLDKYSPKKT
jgi:isocitrate lyase